MCGVPVPLPFFNIILRKTCCVHTLSADALCGYQSACHSIIVTVLECQDCSDDGEQLSDFEDINYSEPTQFSGSSKLAEAADDWDSILDFDPMQSSHSVIIDDVQHEVDQIFDHK